MPTIKYDEANKLILEMQAMQSRAHACGLHVAARGLNRAMNAAGWELAGMIGKAGDALTTDHA